MADYLDLSGEITEEQHREVYESLLRQFETWRRERGWCTELYTSYVSRLSPVFKWEYAGDYDRGPQIYGGHGGVRIKLWLDFTYVTDRAQDLRELRGRILRFVIENPDHIDATRASRFLSTAGLEPWEPEPAPPGPRTYEVSFYGAASTELTQEQIQAKLTRLARALGMPSHVVAASVTERPPRRTTYIPHSATVPLLSPRH